MFRRKRDNSRGLAVGQVIAKDNDCIGVLVGGRGKGDVEFLGRGRLNGARGSVQITARAWGKDTVEVLFSDDGCGMSPEVRRQVFDPFFTTRRDQGSTGLGLHIVHNIVTNRLGGRINLETRPGAGTKIRIVVPREAPLEFAAE